MKTLGEKVKELRTDKHMTQEQLAEKMGYKVKQSISRIENGRPVTQKIIKRLAEALDTTEAYLLGFEDDEIIVEINYQVNKMSNENLERLLSYAKYLNEQNH